MTTVPVADAIDAPFWAIRPEQPIDLDLIHDLHREAFRRPNEAEVVDAVRSGADFVPELSLVAVSDDGSVLGHVLVSRVAFELASDASVRQDALALAPLGVLPPHSGRGIGSALVREAVALADERDEPFVVVLGPPAFYMRFGFVAAAEHGISGPYDEAGEAFQVRARQGEPALVPGTVVYPRIFDSL